MNKMKKIITMLTMLILTLNVAITDINAVDVDMIAKKAPVKAKVVKNVKTPAKKAITKVQKIDFKSMPVDKVIEYVKSGKHKYAKYNKDIDTYFYYYINKNQAQMDEVDTIRMKIYKTTQNKKVFINYINFFNSFTKYEDFLKIAKLEDI